ncbi:MAG: hypothetical protein MMC23_004357 [Stictis urceolatum]|nr:hypothetical protein [Stictis urceolata]
MQAIVDYERAHSIPPNWVNFAISRSSESGAWQRAERGESQLDDAWFAAFRADLHSEKVWEEYHRVYAARRNKRGGEGKGEKRWDADVDADADGGVEGKVEEEGKVELPPMPRMDTTTLFWTMMIVSRTPDAHMFPALRRLRESGRFILGALSNTVPFPEWHPFGRKDWTDDIRGVFDVFVGSADVGLRKPNREAYDFAVKRLDEFDRKRGGTGVRAEDVLFLDDIGENLKTGKKVGMKTIRVWLGRTEEAVKELEGFTEMRLSEDKARL